MRSTHSKTRKLARTRWTEDETASLVALYDRMIQLQRADSLGVGKQHNKAKLIRDWIEKHAPGRSKGSVECKLMNISAVCLKMDLAVVEGFKALPNCSRDLNEAVLNYVRKHGWVNN